MSVEWEDSPEGKEAKEQLEREEFLAQRDAEHQEHIIWSNEARMLKNELAETIAHYDESSLVLQNALTTIRGKYEALREAVREFDHIKGSQSQPLSRAATEQLSRQRDEVLVAALALGRLS